MVDSPLTLRGGRLEHVHPPAPFILCQSAGGIEESVLIFIRLPPTLFFLQREGGGLGLGMEGWRGAKPKPRGMKREGGGVGIVRIEGGEKRRMHVVLFKWMGND